MFDNIWLLKISVECFPFGNLDTDTIAPEYIVVLNLFQTNHYLLCGMFLLANDVLFLIV